MYIFCKSSDQYQHKGFGSHWSWSQEGSKNTSDYWHPLDKTEGSLFLLLSCRSQMPRCGCQPQQPLPACHSHLAPLTFGCQKYRGVFSQEAPSHTCQRQSTVLSTAEDPAVILSVTASSSRWKHRQHTQLLAVGAALLRAVESEGQQQLLQTWEDAYSIADKVMARSKAWCLQPCHLQYATYKPGRGRMCSPGQSRHCVGAMQAARRLSIHQSNPTGRGGCVWWGTFTARTTVLWRQQGKNKWEKNTNKPEIQQRGKKKP